MSSLVLYYLSAAVPAVGLREGLRLGVRVDGEAVLGFNEGAMLGYRLGTTVGHLLRILDGTLLGARLSL